MCTYDVCKCRTESAKHGSFVGLWAWSHITICVPHSVEWVEFGMEEMWIATIISVLQAATITIKKSVNLRIVGLLANIMDTRITSDISIHKDNFHFSSIFIFMVWKEFGQFETTHGNDLEEKKSKFAGTLKSCILAHWCPLNRAKWKKDKWNAKRLVNYFRHSL